jgi:hypothetical protein
MENVKKEGVLSRYTSWQAFKYWLENKKIVFGNYTNWEDETDVAILNAYADRIKKQVRVLCFMDRSNDPTDSYYHWKVYANNNGIRVDFKKELLLKYLEKNINSHPLKVECIKNKVEYPRPHELKAKAEDFKNLPFLKRVSYKAEEEYRILCSGNVKAIKKDCPLEIDFKNFKECVERVTLGFPETTLEIRNFLKKHGIKEVSNSKIFRYENWEKIVLNACQAGERG